MRLSIVIPTYNVADYLPYCIESLLNQDLDSGQYEILIINDGSSDSSREIAVSFAQNHPQIRVLDQINQGISTARNTGMDLATGKYIYFLDADDYISKNTLCTILDLMDSKELEVLGLNSKETDRLDLLDATNKETFQAQVPVLDGISYVAANNYSNTAWWYIIKREFLMETGLRFPIGRFVEDANFTAKLLVAANRMSFLNLDFHRYVIRPFSIMRTPDKAHIEKLVTDYKENVLEFKQHLADLQDLNHPQLEPCLNRLRTRMESFVFFGLIKAVRSGLSKDFLNQLLYIFRLHNVYPVQNFTGPDFPGIPYKILTAVVNSKILLRVSRWLFVQQFRLRK